MTLKIRYTPKIQLERQKKNNCKIFFAYIGTRSLPAQLYLLAKLTTFRIYLLRSAIKSVFGQIVPLSATSNILTRFNDMFTSRFVRFYLTSHTHAGAFSFRTTSASCKRIDVESYANTRTTMRLGCQLS